MIRTGQVIAREARGLLVCFERLAACESCKACGRDGKDTSAYVQGEAQVGDRVEVEMPEAQVLKASLLTYLLPLCGLLLGLLAGSLIKPMNELLMVGLGLLFMGVSLVGLRAADRRLFKRRAWQPRVLRVLSAEDEDEIPLPEGSQAIDDKP